MYRQEQSLYPFPTLWTTGNSAADVAGILPPRKDILHYLDIFQKRAQSCYFPHTTDELSKNEVERFLSDVPNNATQAPDMLALIFAMLATAYQMGVHDQYEGWKDGALEANRLHSDFFSE